MLIMKKLLLIVFLFITHSIFSQKAEVFVSDFKLENHAEKWCWAISQDGNKNMLIGVTNGIVVFDGTNQHFDKLPFTPLQIKYDSINKRVWVAGYERIGVMDYSGYGRYNYKELATYSDKEFKNIQFLNDTVYLVSASLLVRFNQKDAAKIDAISSGQTNIEQLFKLKGEPYFIIDYFLYKIENGAFKEINNIDFPVDEFAYAIANSDEEVLVGTKSNTIYSFNGKSFKTYTINQSPFFDNNLVVGGAKLANGNLILSSLAGGIALVDINKKQVINQISYFNGLPDDEIRTFFIDSEQAIWVSHEFGISRIHFTAGIENYSYYPGLKGNPLAISYFENELYVATNDGLFSLSEVKNFHEFEVSVNMPVNVSVTVPAENKPIDLPTQGVSEVQKDNSKSLFSFLSKKKKKTEEVSQTAETIAPAETRKEVTRNETQIVKKRSLKSVGYYFKAIDGVDDKCTQLASYNGFLLVAGNNGLYALKYGKAQKVISNVNVYYIHCSSASSEAFICTSNGLYQLKRNSGSWEIVHFAETTSSRILALAQEPEGTYVLGFENMLIRARFKGRDIEVINQTDLKEAAGRTFYIKNFDNKTHIYNTNSIYEFTTNGELNLEREILIGDYYLGNQTDYLWLFHNENWELKTNAKTAFNKEQLNKLQLFQNLRYIDVSASDDIWVVTENNRFFKISQNTTSNQLVDFNLNVLGVEIEDKLKEFTGDISLKSGQNNLTILLSAPYYIAQKEVYFRHQIKGLDDDWTKWSNDSHLKLNYLRPGSYSLLIEAKSATGQNAELKPIKLKIAKPFVQSALFFVLIILAAGGAFYLFFRYRLIKLEKDKQILEQKVKERTHTIEEQKEHIEKIHDEITQSIRYAKRIQTAMLPHNEIIEAMLPHHFILFKPRDIVSGDFYFFKPIGKKLLFIAADCTGHGVPGGFMSMLGISYLSEISSQIPDPTASEIINHLREKIKLTLGQTSTDSTQKDGMDMTVCLIDTEKKQIQYAGAFNPLYYIRNNELEIVKADRQPVAVYFKEEEFTNNIIEVKKGDIFYMFSDGYVDQNGGPNNRKFMSKNFKDLLLTIHKLPLNEQKEKLTKNIEDWQGDATQVDDILVIGFQL